MQSLFPKIDERKKPECMEVSVSNDGAGDDGEEKTKTTAASK